jgi:UDP-galactopyranose mutase
MTTVPSAAPRGDVLCLSHLRWNFVFQRPQHLMTRCARERRVFFIEEPIVLPAVKPQLSIETQGAVNIVVPQLPAGLTSAARTATLRALLDDLIEAAGVHEYVLWYYTPMALEYTDHLSPSAIVYDCMDELSAFKGAPAALKEREADLLRRSSLV